MYTKLNRKTATIKNEINSELKRQFIDIATMKTFNGASNSNRLSFAFPARKHPWTLNLFPKEDSGFRKTLIRPFSETAKNVFKKRKNSLSVRLPYCEKNGAMAGKRQSLRARE